MFFAALFLAAISFADTKTLALQICLDRAGFSCNTIDGRWGKKSQRALESYCAMRSIPVPETPESAHDLLFSDTPQLFRLVTVSEEDLSSLATLPSDPAEKAKLSRMGYESLKEMMAELGHLSQRAVERLNPGIDWSKPTVGLQIKLPNFASIDEELANPPRERRNSAKHQCAALIKVSLSLCEIAVFDTNNIQIAYFPCSIAKNKSKLPPAGELKIINAIPYPNYTYTPDFVRKGEKMRRYVWPAGPNCPIGVAWLGLNLPGYGIHGTPRPESIGNAESHGCFRLSNWNAARLFGLCRPGTKVLIEP